MSTAVATGTSERRNVVRGAYARALSHLRRVQQGNGALAGEVVWNTMLVSQYVITCHVLGREIAGPRRERIRRAYERQVRADGGFGMEPDPDGRSWLFHTVLAYVALRLLGHAEEDPLVARSLAWIHAHGGVYAIPTWGRIWLALLGLYPWSGVQPILPELWILPDAAPLHPRRLYCHMRLIYLGLSFVYGSRFVAPESPRIKAIARELYPEGMDPFTPGSRLTAERFVAQLDVIAPTDLYEAPSPGLRSAFAIMRRLEPWLPRRVRRRALARALEHIEFELRSTGFVCLSPVNGLLFCLALHITDRGHPLLDRAFAGVEYWAWEDDEDGLRFCGARSDIWDTAFVLQALGEGPPDEHAEAIAREACAWLVRAQMRADVPGGAAHYREKATGGWGFANERHPWPVSDCTAEALEGLLRCEATGLSQASGVLALEDKLAAIEFVLLRQNDDGGFGSYEARRGSMALRRFNPAEIYGNCMLEYSYTECTGSCIRALAHAERELGEAIPVELRRRMRAAVDRGAAFVLGQERARGGWYGFWGINVTYGTFFAVAGLLGSGIGRSHPVIVRATRWLVEAQRADGGWGESAEGMLHERDIPLPPVEPSLVVQTAWAVLTLLEAAPHEREAIERGIEFLRARQQGDGSWPRERASGCFFNTAVLSYELYRQYFPAWALARYLRVYGG